MMDVLIVTSVLLVGLISFELLARLTKIPQAFMRKLIHVGMCLLVAGFTFFVDYRSIVWTGLFFVVLLLIARKVFKFHSLRDRRDESWGEIFFPLGVALSALIAPNQTAFIAAILILAFSDTVAYIIGNRFPKSRVIVPGRTIAGSGAGFITSVLILLALHYGTLVAVGVALLVTCAEIFSRKGFDNVAMPVVAAVAISLVSQWF